MMRLLKIYKKQKIKKNRKDKSKSKNKLKKISKGYNK